MSKARPKRKRLYVLGSIVVTIAVFSVIFSFISVDQVLNMLESADLNGVWMFMGLSFLMSFCRAWRYQLLLRISGFSPRIITVYLVVLVGNFFSDLLPARLGTLIYVFIITTRMGVPFGAALSSFAVAFLFDMLSLAPLLFLIVLGVGGGDDLPLKFLFLVGALVALISTMLLRYLPQVLHWLALRFSRLKLISETKRAKLMGSLESAGKEIRQTMAAGVGTRLLILSLAIRVIKYGAQYMFLLALLRPLGYQFATLNISKVFLGICASETAASIPFAGVGGFGIYEGTWALVFKLLGFPGDIAALTSVAVHLFVQVYGYVLGAIALGILLLPIFKTEEARPHLGASAEGVVYFYAKLVVCLGLLTLAFVFSAR